MATSIQITSGSLFCGNPIMVSIGAESPGIKAVFHRVKLEVSAALMGISSDYHTYTLSSPATDAEVIEIDISSALRSVSELFEYSYLTENKTYPYLVYTLKTYDEYMVDGILNERVGERNYGSSLSALIGAFTDMERYISGTSKSIQKFSRKPSKGELCATSDTLFYPTSLSAPISVGTGVNSGPTVIAYPLAAVSGAGTYAGHSVYVIPASPLRFSFQFVNSLGVIESISVSTLEESEFEKTISEYTVTTSGGFNRIRRNIIRKLSNREVIKMSTGPVSESWEDWFINEFLETEQAWVNMDGYWVPCSIVPEDTTKGINRASTDFPEVFFSVKLNIAGGIKNRL